MKKYLIFLIVALMVLTLLPMSAMALPSFTVGDGQSLDLSTGVLTNTADDSVVTTYTFGVFDVVQVSGNVTITGIGKVSLNCSAATTLTLDAVSIDNSGVSASTVVFAGSGNTLFIKNTVTLFSEGNAPGISVVDGVSLIIKDGGNGVLNVTAFAGAGIGGYSVSVPGSVPDNGGGAADAGDITIESGTINSVCTTGSAGIGGGSGGSGGNISISGGVVSAIGGYGGAGIGGGILGYGGNITITDGTITALGDEGGAGIGGGDMGDSGTILISGGTVDAKSVIGGAGIGTGGMMESASTGSIEITGGDVSAVSGALGSGIGGGLYVSNNSISISGGNVYASGVVSISIASTEGYAPQSIAQFTGGTGIGGGPGDERGPGGNGGSIVISGGNIEAHGGNTSAGIGSGLGADGGTINISGGNVEAYGGKNSDSLFSEADDSSLAVLDAIFGNGAGIGGGGNGTGGDITISGGVVAGFGGAPLLTGASLDSSTEGSVDGSDAAGIGCGGTNYSLSDSEINTVDFGSVTITGGIVYGGGEEGDIGPFMDISISGCSAVFLRNDLVYFDPVLPDSHEHKTSVDAVDPLVFADNSVYGIDVDSSWTDATGGYFRLFTLSYDNNGGSGTVADKTVHGSANVTTDDGAGLSKEDYTFNGWNTNVAGTGTHASAGGKLQMECADATLYAEWSGPAKGTISTVIKDGSGNPLVGYNIELHSVVVTGITDANGRVKFSDVALVDHTLIIKDGGGTEIGQVDLDMVHGTSSSSSISGNNVDVVFSDDTVSVEIKISIENGRIIVEEVIITDNPDTGDSSNLWWIAIAVLLLAAGVFLIIRKRVRA